MPSAVGFLLARAHRDIGLVRGVLDVILWLLLGGYCGIVVMSLLSGGFFEIVATTGGSRCYVGPVFHRFEPQSFLRCCFSLEFGALSGMSKWSIVWKNAFVFLS